MGSEPLRIRDKCDHNGDEAAFASVAGVEGDPNMSTLIVNRVGLTKREYFAGVALQGMVANPTNHPETEADYARWAVRYADVLLAELEKPVAKEGT